MKRKSNPWLSLIALVLLGVILASICTGCTTRAAAAAEAAPRFTGERHDIGNGYGVVITDTQTGEQYLWVHSGYAGGLTHLEGVHD